MAYSSGVTYRSQVLLVAVLLFVAVSQLVIVVVREILRYQNLDDDDGKGNNAKFSNLHFSCWLALFVFCPFLNILIGAAINGHDVQLRDRHLQFLRLEFDTKLGMHSPR